MCDIFFYPSVQDNLPGMVMEASTCGTPVVAFDVGGVSKIVEHRRGDMWLVIKM